jgi:hypothetical protein
MTLHEAILSASPSNEETVIYAFVGRVFWEPASPCLLVEEEEDEQIIQRNGQTLYYFLEISTLLEVIEGWREIGKGDRTTDADIVDFVIYYAQNDSWPAP